MKNANTNTQKVTTGELVYTCLLVQVNNPKRKTPVSSYRVDARKSDAVDTAKAKAKEYAKTAKADETVSIIKLAKYKYENGSYKWEREVLETSTPVKVEKKAKATAKPVAVAPKASADNSFEARLATLEAGMSAILKALEKLGG